MIDLSKKWRTRCGWPVENLTVTPAGMLDGDLFRPDAPAPDRFRWAPNGTILGFDRNYYLNLVPAEDEPAAPALPDLDARLYLIGCAISGAIASADADINPDPRLTAKWAVEFADEVLAMLAEQKDGAA